MAAALTVRPSVLPPSRRSAASVLFLAVLSAIPGTLVAQGESAGGVEVTPDGGTDPNRAETSSYSTTFSVLNDGIFQYTFILTCGRTGAVASCINDLEQITLAAGASGNVPVQYTTGSPGSGSVSLTASRIGASDQGSVNVTVLAAGVVVPNLVRNNTDNVDRGLCLTVGAGEAAGLSCGDLFVVQGMPTYRSLGRDRSVSLYYNSASATGLTLLPAWFKLPHTIGRPTSIRVVLDVTGSGYKDSVTYSVPGSPICGAGCSDSFQVVSGKNLAWPNLSTGYYPVTLTFRSIYQTQTLSTAALNGNILVLNRSASEYGRGWGLLGVEKLVIPTSPSDTTQRVWVAGDGSMRVYHRGAGVTSGQLSASGLTSFSAANSVDGNLTNTAWTTSSGTATTAYARANLGASFPQAVTSARLYAATATNATYDVQYSSNGTSWTTVLAGFKPQAGWSSVVWSSVGAYRYWQLKVANNNGVSSTIRELSFGAALNFYGAPGDAPDSLVRFDSLSNGILWYRRDLKHGASVKFDATGAHRVTTNRVGARTVFSWSGTPTRLSTITVPPDSGTAKNYTFTWNGSLLLDSIRDPGGRGLKATLTSGNLVKLRAPAKLDSTRFAYDVRNVLVKRIATRQKNTTKGDSAVTTYTYANSARVTQVAVQADSAGSQNTTTTIAPWDEHGLTTMEKVDTAGFATRVDGPLAGTNDAVDIRVDRFGQARRTNHLGLGTLSIVKRDSVNSFPALPTEVRAPHPATAGAVGMITRMSWNPRGNLVQQRDSSSHLGAEGLPLRVVGYEYNDGDAPDSPSRVVDPLGRFTDFSYNSTGLTDRITDARLHKTAFTYVTGGALKGQMLTVTDSAVAVWRQSDSAEVANQHLTTSLSYDANGNVLRVTAPDNTITSYTVDALGRLLSVHGPDSSRVGRLYDALNRDTAQITYTNAQPHPGNPTLTCDAQYVTCYSAAWDIDTGPDTLITRFYQGPVGLDSVVDQRGVQRYFGYDVQGRAVRETDEYQESKRSAYSVAGLLTSSTSRQGFQNGTSVTYQYDALGRDSAMIMPAVNYGAVRGDTIRTTYDLLGRKLVVTNWQSTITRAYFADGSLRTQKTVFGGDTHSLAFRYDASGARTAFFHAYRGDPSIVDSVQYHYGTATGDLDSLSLWWDTDSTAYAARRVFKFQWDALGRRRMITYPNAVDAMRVHYRYDKLGGLRVVSDTNPGDPEVGWADHFDFTWKTRTRDVMGRALSQVITCSADDYYPGSGACQGVTANKISTTNVYSRRGMLTRQHRPELATEFQNDTLGYDESGNLIRRRGHVFPMFVNKNRLAWDSTVGASSSLTVPYLYNYDGARHNEAGFGSDTRRRDYYYDGLGRMGGAAAFKTALDGEPPDWVPYAPECKYDADGQLAKPCDGNDHLFFDGPNVVRASTGVIYIWHFLPGLGVDDPLIGFMRGEPGGQSKSVRELFYVGDGSGRLFAVADSAGELDTDVPVLHEAYGRQGWQYAGGASNAESFNASRMQNSDYRPLSFFRHRAYDPATGRWTQEDPIGIAGGLNLYQFNGNNPVTYTDPFGLKKCPPDCGLLHAVAAGAFGAVTAVAGASAGAAAGTVTVPIIGTVSGAYVGGTAGFAAGAAAGVAAANLAEATAEAGAVVVERGMTKLEKAFVTVMSLFSLTTGGPKIQPPEEKKVPPPPTPIEQPSGPGGPPRPARPFRIEGVD